MSEETDDERAIDRITKLLRKAERTDNPHEAEAFYAKAQQIATAEQIQAAAARLAGRATDKPIRVVIPFGEPDSSFWDASKMLFFVTANANDVFTLAVRRTGEMWAYGYSDDIHITEAMYASLLIQMTEAAQNYLANESPARGKKRLEAKRSFYAAYAEQIGILLFRAKNAATDAATGRAALALRGKRGEVEDFFNQDLRDRDIHTVRRGADGGSDPKAAAAGDKAARKARLGANDNLTSRRLELSQ